MARGCSGASWWALYARPVRVGVSLIATVDRTPRPRRCFLVLGHTFLFFVVAVG